MSISAPTCTQSSYPPQIWHYPLAIARRFINLDHRPQQPAGENPGIRQELLRRDEQDGERGAPRVVARAGEGAMAEIISCPSCQRKLQVPVTLARQDVQCPGCGATFVAHLPEPALPRDRPRDPPSWVRGPLEDDGFGPGMQRRDLAPHRGALILTLGLLGLVGLPIISPIAWIMGNTDVAEIRAGRMDPDGEGLTQAGRICGIIGTAFLSLMLCFCGLLFVSAAGGR